MKLTLGDMLKRSSFEDAPSDDGATPTAHEGGDGGGRVVTPARPAIEGTGRQ